MNVLQKTCISTWVTKGLDSTVSSVDGEPSEKPTRLALDTVKGSFGRLLVGEWGFYEDTLRGTLGADIILWARQHTPPVHSL